MNMERLNRTRCVLLGLICLMPALFFWALKSLPIEFGSQPTLLFFGGATRLEFIIAGFIFPILSIGLGWNAYKRCENRSFSLTIMTVGAIELMGALIAAFLGVAI